MIKYVKWGALVAGAAAIGYVAYVGFSDPRCPSYRSLGETDVSLSNVETGCSMTLRGASCTSGRPMTKIGAAVANTFSLVELIEGGATLRLNEQPGVVQQHYLASEEDPESIAVYLNELANLCTALLASAHGDGDDFLAKLSKNELGFWIWRCDECGSTLSNRMLMLPAYLAKHDLLNKSLDIRSERERD